MKKQILNLGKLLNKKQQKQINGGFLGGENCISDGDCQKGFICNCSICIDPTKPYIPCD